MEGIPDRVESFFSWWMPAVFVTISLATFFAIQAQQGGRPFAAALVGGALYTAILVFAAKMSLLSYRLLRRAVRGPEEVPEDVEDTAEDAE